MDPSFGGLGVLYCAVLYCTVLYCIVFYYFIFAFGYPVVPAFAKRDIYRDVFSMALLFHLCQKLVVHIYVGLFLDSLFEHFILFYLFVFMPISWLFLLYVYVSQLGSVSPPNLFFFKIVVAIGLCAF